MDFSSLNFFFLISESETEETEISTTEETTTTETITTTTTTLVVAPEEEEDTEVKVVDETHTTTLEIAPNFVKPLVPDTRADEGDTVRYECIFYELPCNCMAHRIPSFSLFLS